MAKKKKKKKRIFKSQVYTNPGFYICQLSNQPECGRETEVSLEIKLSTKHIGFNT